MAMGAGSWPHDAVTVRKEPLLMTDLDPGDLPRTFTAEHDGVLADVNHSAGHGAEQQAAAVVIILTARMGHNTDPRALRLAWRASPPHASDSWSGVDTEVLFDAAEEAANWLTEHHAPEGCCFDFTERGDFELRRARIPATPLIQTER